MPPLDQASLLPFLVQAGFAGLFVWLLNRTQTESADRERRANEREDKLRTILEQYAEQLTRLTQSVARIEQKMDAKDDNSK